MIIIGCNDKCFCSVFHPVLNMDKRVEVNILLWRFLEFLDVENERQNRFWVHPINQKRNISRFIRELRKRSRKFL